MANFKINNGVVIDYTNEGWAEFKKWLDGTYASLLYAWVDEGLAYSIAAVDGSFYRTVSINKTDATDFEANYKKEQPTTPPIAEQDADNRLRVSQEPRREGDGLVFVTHNWCDPTTWYTQSERVLAETLTDSGDGLTFDSANDNWIDLTHGKIYRENLISTPYLPVIKVDGSTKTERAPWAGSGGDFSINYKTGKVTFFVSQAGKTVVADYSRENGSLFIVAPTVGKRLWVEYSEVQFSKDVDIASDTNFQPWAYNPASPPNKIPVAEPTTYRTLDNFIEEANGCYPAVPAMGGVRGFTQDRITFPFRYQTVKELRSDWGLEIRIWVEGDVPFEGEYGTATFYCTSYNE